MMKRIVSVLLAIQMVSLLAVPTVRAAQTELRYDSDDIYIADGADVIFGDTKDKTLFPTQIGKGGEIGVTVDHEYIVPEAVGQASVTDGDVTVDALGVPKDSSLKLGEVKPEAEKVAEDMLDGRNDIEGVLFSGDISVQD